MQSFIVISAILACATAAPAYLLAEQEHVLHSVPLAKSTFSQSSQVIDHGSTFIHTPVHPVVHTVSVPHVKTTITKSNHEINHGSTSILHPVHTIMPVHEVYSPAKSTVTQSKQVIHHGTALVHAPVVHSVHEPLVHSVHAPVVLHTSPLVSLKTGDSAVTHQSSTVHETVPVVQSASLYVHH